MQEFWRWWGTVPTWAKPIILGAAITLVAGIFVWLFTKAIPAVIGYFFSKRRERMRESVLTIFEDHPSAMIQESYLADQCSGGKVSKIKPILRELQNQDLIHRFGGGWQYGPKPKAGGRFGLS